MKAPRFEAKSLMQIDNSSPTAKNTDLEAHTPMMAHHSERSYPGSDGIGDGSQTPPKKPLHRQPSLPPKEAQTTRCLLPIAVLDEALPDGCFATFAAAGRRSTNSRFGAPCCRLLAQSTAPSPTGFNVLLTLQRTGRTCGAFAIHFEDEDRHHPFRSRRA